MPTVPGLTRAFSWGHDRPHSCPQSQMTNCVRPSFMSAVCLSLSHQQSTHVKQHPVFMSFSKDFGPSEASGFIWPPFEPQCENKDQSAGRKTENTERMTGAELNSANNRSKPSEQTQKSLGSLVVQYFHNSAVLAPDRLNTGPPGSGRPACLWRSWRGASTPLSLWTYQGMVLKWPLPRTRRGVPRMSF